MSQWKELARPNNLSILGLKETLEGGQTFSWCPTSPNSWVGCFRSKVAELKFKDGMLFWKTSSCGLLTEEEIKDYLWLDSDYEGAIDQLPWRSDDVLKKCVKTLPGLTILKQPLDEVLFYFILSSAKSIPQIKEIGSLVCQKWGQALGNNLWGFPGWSKLSKVREEDLRKLKLGYRAKYVHDVAQVVGDDPSYFSNISQLSYDDAKSELIRLPGVGPKIADCALLFGANKTEAFPIDTWIAKVLDSHYGLEPFTYSQKALFARKHFGLFCGLAQQFLFSGERLGLIKSK